MRSGDQGAVHVLLHHELPPIAGLSEVDGFRGAELKKLGCLRLRSYPAGFLLSRRCAQLYEWLR